MLDMALNDPEEFELQDKIIALNLKTNVELADQVLKSKKFTQFDHNMVARLCEEVGLFGHAFNLYTKRIDQKRVIQQATDFEEDAIFEFFDGFIDDFDDTVYDKEQALQVLDQMLKTSKSNQTIVAKICITFIDEEN